MCLRRFTFSENGEPHGSGGSPSSEHSNVALASSAENPKEAVRLLVFAFGESSIDVRVGVHFGRVVVSRLGPAQHQHITATGDCVNVTSRLLEVAKNQGAALCCSESLFVAAGSPEIGLGPPQETAIRGRAQPLTVRFGAMRGDGRGESAFTASGSKG